MGGNGENFNHCLCEGSGVLAAYAQLYGSGVHVDAQLYGSGVHVDDIVMSRDDSENAQFRVTTITRTRNSAYAQFRLTRNSA